MDGGTTEREGMCARYLAGESSLALAKDYGIGKKAVLRCLERAGIQRRSLSVAKRMYMCNHSFFSSIDTEAAAYWLGFIAADGCVTRKRVLVVGLARKDRDHLQHLLAALGSTHIIRDFTNNRGKCPGTEVSGIAIASPEIAGALARYGVVPAKTFSLRWPDLPEVLLRHYLRGYFDGDGCFTGGRKQAGSIQFSLAGNREFLLGCQQFLVRSAGVAATRLIPMPNTPEGAYLAYCGTGNICAIADLMYRDATIYLPRKRAVVGDLKPARGRYRRRGEG